jgi:hypothetical protein
MAGVGDWQVLDELRAKPKTADVPIITCSGAVEELRAAQDGLKNRGCEILDQAVRYRGASATRRTVDRAGGRSALTFD